LKGLQIAWRININDVMIVIADKVLNLLGMRINISLTTLTAL